MGDCCNGCTCDQNQIEDETERVNYLFFRIARHLWAIMLIIAELVTGTKPNWRKDE